MGEGSSLYKEFFFTVYIMLLIAVSYRRCGRNFRAKLDTAINSLSANLPGNLPGVVTPGSECRHPDRVGKNHDFFEKIEKIDLIDLID